MIKKLGILLGALAILTFFSSLGWSANRESTFTFRVIGEPETLDWNRAHTPVETHILLNLMEGLVGFDSQFKIGPALAQSWTKSSDGKTYTFRLRPGVKWSDGVPLKAQDFIFSWKRLLTSTTAASYAYFLFDIEGAESFYKGELKDFSKVGVKATDDVTLVVKLANPVAHWIYIPSFWVTFPLREDLIQKYQDAWTRPGKMVTVGPFTLASHTPEDKIVLKANPNYYGPKTNIQEAVGLIVKDDSTATTLFETGKLDFMTDIPSTELQRFEGKPELKAFPYLKTGYMGFVLSKGNMSNVHLRRAIAMSIDKSQFGAILHGGQRPATTFVPTLMMGHSTTQGLEFNPQKAKQELKESGVDVSKGVQLDLLSANWEKSLTVAQYIQSQLKTHLGIAVNIHPFDHKTFRSQLNMRSFSMFINGWSADFPDPDNFLSLFQSDAGNNKTGWQNKKFDDLVVKARYLQDAKGRQKLYQSAQKLLLEEEAVILPLYYEPNMALIQKRVKGLDLNPLNYLMLKKVTLAGS